jgi:hypothetical protein
MRAEPLVLPPVKDVIALCEECGKLQRREALSPAALAFAVRCAACDDPLGGDALPTAVTALVPVVVTQSDDRGAWRVRILSPDETAQVRARTAWMAIARCPACDRLLVGHEAQCGRFSETHLPAQCRLCGSATEAIALEPSTVSRSYDGQEWHVVFLEDDALERLRAGVNPYESNAVS